MHIKTITSIFFSTILLFVLSACSGGGGGGGSASSTTPTPTSTAKQGITFSIGKSAVVSTKTTGKAVSATTLDPAARYASVTVTDSNGTAVLTDFKVDIYSLTDSYITATIPLEPGNYNLTQFLILDANNKVLYLVPTQSATADIKSLVTQLLPVSFSVVKDVANTITLQVVASNLAPAKDYGYPSVIFDIVDGLTFMTSAQVLDKTIRNWLLVDATLTINGVSYSLAADKTAVLRIAKATSYTLVYSKTGYITKTITLTETEMANYLNYPLVVVLEPGPPPNPSGMYVFDLKWGGSGSGNGELSIPYGLTLDQSGNIYVADQGNYRIQKFSSTGTYITQFGGLGWGGAGKFTGPTGIVIDPAGNIYVTDYGNNVVQKFDSSGVYITQWGGGAFDPCGIALDAAGNVYVADRANNRIQKFTSSGVFISQWGTAGTGDGQFSAATGIAIDSSDNIYVVDFYGTRVQKFDKNGVFITKWGSLGAGDGQFSAIYGIAVDQSGYVYVSDYTNNNIQKFSSNGTFITKFGSPGSGDGQLSNPAGMVIDASGNVYVADYNNRIQRFRKQ